jgi:group I intron endonuclease
LEYIGLNKVDTSTIDKAILKNNLLEREQFYFDLFKPTLNINKIAGSTLGFKHSEETRLLMSLQRKGKSINRRKQNISYIISEETKNNLSLRTRHGVIVKVVDKK